MRFVLVLLAVPVVAAGGPPPHRPAGAEDVLYFAPDRPIVLRFHARLDGRTPEGPVRSEFLGPTGGRSRGADSGAIQEPNGAPLFACLDANNDGRLSESEFQRAAEILRTLDLDDDETIGAAELEPLGNPTVPAMAARAGTSTPSGILMPVSAAKSPRGLVKRLIERYDRADNATGKDHRLGREELALTGPEFEPFDLDEDGRLDFDELTQWVRRPVPAVEIIVQLGKRENADRPVQLIRRGDGLDADIRTAAPGPATLALEKLQIEIDVHASAVGDHTLLQVGTEARTLFEVLDRNGDRRLSVRELRAAAGCMDLWDQNDDGWISQAEIPSHVRLTFRRARPSPGNTAEAVSGRSRKARAWFQLMDRNGDGDISRREFLGRIEDFRAMDVDGDGLIDAREAHQVD